MAILLILVVLVISFTVVAALQPSEFSITRSTAIAAPPETVFDQVNDLRKWEAWSPWADLYPSTKISYDGPPSGFGTAISWVGNQEVGAGRITIVESRPYELIRCLLQFVRPYVCTHQTQFTFRPAGHQTEVTWNMIGARSFLTKAFSLVMDCDHMVGEELEQGLAHLKTVAEAEAKRQLAQYPRQAA